MRRLFLSEIDPSAETRIVGEKAHYLSTVLRLKKGEELILFDGRGASYRTRITGITKREVRAEILGIDRTEAESPLDMCLIQGLLKGDKMDLVVQKTTELGVKEIIPAVTGRSQFRDTRKVPRWRKIAEEAAQQCGRTTVPHVHDTLLFEEIFSSSGIRARCRGLLFWEEEGTGFHQALQDLEASGPLSIAVGPEGGFTREEAAIGESAGLLITSLGTRILRAETAAIATAAILQFSFGDLG
jgi:16S rRNA (uracil1498-N3)-methyltransferase